MIFFQQTFIKDKVTEWVKELETLVTVAQTQPHAAYASFTHGVMAKWNYVLRVTKLEELSLNLLQPLEHAIRTCFFPSLTGQSAPNDLLRELLALPPKLGGLGLVNPINSAAQQYQSSCHVSSHLVDCIQQQSAPADVDFNNSQQRTKSEEKNKKTTTMKESAEDLMPKLSHHYRDACN